MDRLKQSSLEMVFGEDGITCGRITGDFTNSYYVASDPSINRLLNSPEVVSYDVYKALLPATVKVIGYLNDQGMIHPVNILSILRGALNYPMEEACCLNSIPVQDISFLSSERVFNVEGIPDGLEIKYCKLDAVDQGTLLLGDIIASGETFEYCLNHVLEYYRSHNARLKNIIFFTVGGIMGIDLAERMTASIREFWPEFEGFVGIFYGGLFNCYQDKGVIGFQRKNIDFYWAHGILDPYYRKQTLSQRDPLFEKCIIYDGGARRYEINEHIEEVLEYWEEMLKRCERIRLDDLLEERLGYPLDIDYKNWLEANHYQLLDEKLSQELYEQEKAWLKDLHEKKVTVKEIAETRIREFTEALKDYRK